MANLYQIPFQLWEQIVNKLDWKSYFRLQQTCHDMADFIRTNRNVKVCMPEKFWMLIDDDDTGFPNCVMCYRNEEDRILNYPVIRKIHKMSNLECLYGVRVSSVEFRFDRDRDEPVDDDLLLNVCNILEKYRITSDKIDSSDLDLTDYEPPIEHCEKILKILKPEQVVLGFPGVDLPGIALPKKRLKYLCLSTECEYLQDLTVIKKLMESANSIEIGDPETNIIGPYIDVAKKIVQCLRSQPFSDLQDLTFILFNLHDEQYTVEELLEVFRDFNPNHQDKDVRPTEYCYYYRIELQLGLDGRQCSLSCSQDCETLTMEFERIN